MTAFRIAVAAALASFPLFGQYDLTGEWGARYHEDFSERIPGPELGDYLGLPINDAARLRADSWDASIATLPEWQCRPHPADYGTRGPADLRIWKEVDTQTQQVIAYHTHVQWQAQERTIWMDGRILTRTLHTPGRDSRQGSGMAISLPSPPRISKRVTFAVMEFRAAIAPCWWNTGFATATFWR